LFFATISKDFDSALEELAFVYYDERREQELNLKLFYNNELLLKREWSDRLLEDFENIFYGISHVK
jgi:hypothetical protein